VPADPAQVSAPSVALAETIRCQGYEAPGRRCTARGITKWKRRWLCAEHAVVMRKASTELVRIEPGHCPTCGAPTQRDVVQEQPLLRHGGYGAARRTVTENCTRTTCSWWLTVDISEERPT
jgi:hypothetical protein